jgi:excinuclease ABC subunit B
MDQSFRLQSAYQPAGDQPQAIAELTRGLQAGRSSQVLMGVTGSGKTFTMANIIAQSGRPALVLSHNKTLAAQLFSEFREFFPDNAVHYFVSYYDYYQPEAYIPQRDIYIEKDASINSELDRLRLASTSSLISRRDVVIVASVSCIYGLGSPIDYKRMQIRLVKGESIDRDDLLRRLVDVLYDRNDVEFVRGTFRVRGDVVELWPAYEEFAYRIELFGDEIDQLSMIHPVSGQTLKQVDETYIYPAKHFVLPEDRLEGAVKSIRAELDERLKELQQAGKLLEAQRLSARTRFDLEMLQEVGHCPGIENYSRHLVGRAPGERPHCLLDFFPPDYLCFIDESHQTIPQIQAMYAGDRSRKQTLVDHGFRLPSALDNRPLKFAEWEQMASQIIYVSATPGPYELGKSGGEVVEQVIRPTGLIDPPIEIHPARGQVPHLVEQIRQRVRKKQRSLVTTLTKRLAEDLSAFLNQENINCKWLHSELDAIERVELLRELREGKFDVLVGVNLLREGLDLPEVTLVAILDADKEGFLRSQTALIQTIGRAARNIQSVVILYADSVTPSMQRAIDETDRRRAKQIAYNQEHGITPKTIEKAIKAGIEEEILARRIEVEAVGQTTEEGATQEFLSALEAEMQAAAADLDFERAAKIRDRILELKGQQPMAGGGPQRRKRRTGRPGKSAIPRPKRPTGH